MSINGRFLPSVLGIALAGTIASCGGGSTPAAPSPSGSPTVTGLNVTGISASLKPGDSAQLTATASLSNGTTNIVTNQATWRSDNTDIATVSGSGVVTAVSAGTTEIRASYQNVNASVRLDVAAAPQPPAPQTYSLCGTIIETSGSLPISEVVVEVRDRINAGKRTQTDGNGRYCLTNLAPDSFTLRVSKVDYEQIDQGLTLIGDMTLNFSMRRAQGQFSLCGLVTESLSATTISGAVVEVRDHLNAGRNATTDAAGHYCIATLIADSFTLRVSKVDYEQIEQGLTLTGDMTLNFSMRRAQGQYSLCGLVTESPAASAISGALVEVRDHLNAGRNTTTDAAGHYCIATLFADTFIVRASRSSYDTVEQSVTLSGDATVNFALRVTRPTITIGSNGAVSPKQIIIAVGQSVTFVNNHVQNHEMDSDPHPIHTDCPEINVGLLAPGQSRTTSAITRVVTCGYHDHLDPFNSSLMGTIVVR
jgi:plastocyanin